MGPFYSKDRASNSVQGKISPVKGPRLLPAINKSALGRRGCQSSHQRGSGANHTGKSRLLFPDISSTERERETQADYRSIHPESIRSHSRFQDGNSEKGQKCRRNERLFIRHDRCLFICTDSSAVSQISSFHFEQQSIPVQRSSIRSSYKPLCVYFANERHSNLSKKKGYNSSSLSRRLVSKEPKSFASVETQTIHHVFDQLPGSDDQLRKFRSDPCLTFYVHRDGISDGSQYRKSSSTESSEFVTINSGLCSKETCISQSFPVSFGTNLCGCRFCNARQITSPTVTNVFTRPVATPEITATSSNSGDQGYCVTPHWWKQETIFQQGVLLKMDPPSHTIFTDASLAGWGAHVEPDGLLLHGVWTEAHSHLHINVGDVGHISVSEECSSGNREFNGSSFHGQYNGGVLPETSGRNTFTGSMCGSLESSQLVCPTRDPTASQAHTREIQHSRGPVES